MIDHKLTPEELEEAKRLVRPENRREFEELMKKSLYGPQHPVVEKLAWETLKKVRGDMEVLESLKKQALDEINKLDTEPYNTEEDDD